MAAPEFEKLVGTRVLGRYEIVRFLAQGGMGAIHLARATGAAGFVRPVVIKQILGSHVGDDSALGMFVREARIMANLRHPQIVNIVDFAEDKGMYYMVLEYVHGAHLGRWLSYLRKTGAPFPVNIAIQIVLETLEALEYAHNAVGLDGKALGIIHRDIKPSNILIDVAGHVKLADFGIARSPRDRTDTSDTTAKLKGTFAYLAPELFDAQEPDQGSDVYACAVLLHTLLAGKNEFAADEVAQTVGRVLNHVPTRLDSIRADVSPALAEVIARAQHKNPSNRYRSARALASALRKTLEVSEDHAKEQLRTLAGSTFRDRRFARTLGIDDLSTLELVLTDDGQGSQLTLESSERLIEESETFNGGYQSPTRAASADETADPTQWDRPSSKRRARETTDRVDRRNLARSLLIALAAVVIGGGGVFAYMTAGAKPEEALPTVIVASPADQDNGAGTEGTAPSPSTPTAAKGADSAPESAPPRPKAKAKKAAKPVNKAKSPQAIIDSEMAERRPAFHKCFRAHVDSRVTEVQLRFGLDKSGRVSFAAIDGRGVSDQLRDCLLAVARAIHFRGIDAPLRFKVPLRGEVR